MRLLRQWSEIRLFWECEKNLFCCGALFRIAVGFETSQAFRVSCQIVLSEVMHQFYCPFLSTVYVMMMMLMMMLMIYVRVYQSVICPPRSAFNWFFPYLSPCCDILHLFYSDISPFGLCVLFSTPSVSTFKCLVARFWYRVCVCVRTLMSRCPPDCVLCGNTVLSLSNPWNICDSRCVCCC